MAQIQGPGLGWNQDYASFDNSGKFSGIQNTPQPGRTYPSQEQASGSRYDELKGIADQGNLNPSQKTEWEQYMQAQPQQPSIDFDALIRPALEGLDAAIAPLTQQTENQIGQLQAGAKTATQSAQQSFGAQQQQLDTARTSAQQEGQSAADEARRQYSEIAQGQQARYGGSTGTGRFANEILGAQTLRNIGQVRQQVSNAVLQIDEKKQQVEEIGRIALQDIQDKTTDQIQQARDNLNIELSKIRQQKGELQARKAEMAANAIQIYQNQVAQVNQSNAQFLQQLFMQQQQATQQLELAKQRAAQTASEIPELKFSVLGEGQTLVGYNPQTGEQVGSPIAGLAGGGSEFDSLLNDLGLGGGTQGVNTGSNQNGQLTPALNKLGVGLGI